MRNSAPPVLTQAARLLAEAACLMLVSCVSPRYVKPAPQEHEHAVYHAAQPPPGGTPKWNPVWWIGNADDPQPPEWYRPDQRLRGPLWQLRNPLHNFTFYIIGIHDKEFVRCGKIPGAVFHPEGGWNWAVAERGFLRLPFVSYQGRYVRWYALWREKGNFGLKFQRTPKKADKP